MILPILAALPAIFSVVGKVTDLFSSGKKAVKEITGKDSQASTPEELQEEVQNLPPGQQVKWVEIMHEKVEMYKAENERLDIEIGRVDTSRISPEAASKIAIMRQTTRPWAVRMMIHYIFFPWYLIIVDVAQELFNTWVLSPFGLKALSFKTFDYVFGVLSFDKMDKGTLEKISDFVQGPQAQTLMASMYMETVGWASAIVLGYMGLREIGKVKGASGDTVISTSQSSTFSSVVKSGLGLVSKVKAIFK